MNTIIENGFTVQVAGESLTFRNREPAIGNGFCGQRLPALQNFEYCQSIDSGSTLPYPISPATQLLLIFGQSAIPVMAWELLQYYQHNQPAFPEADR
jgi:hypothetical protein